MSKWTHCLSTKDISTKTRCIHLLHMRNTLRVNMCSLELKQSLKAVYNIYIHTIQLLGILMEVQQDFIFMFSIIIFYGETSYIEYYITFRTCSLLYLFACSLTPYSRIVHLKHGSMLKKWDCPGSGTTNTRQTTGLFLTRDVHLFIYLNVVWRLTNL